MGVGGGVCLRGWGGGGRGTSVLERYGWLTDFDQKLPFKIDKHTVYMSLLGLLRLSNSI